MAEDAVTNVAFELQELRGRLDWSMARMARELGYKTTSGYQRYENEEHMAGKSLSNALVLKLLNAISGKGYPPIEEQEILGLAADPDLRVRAAFRAGQKEPVTIPVVGVVAEGVWRDKEEMTRFRFAQVPKAPGSFEGYDQFALLIRDNSCGTIMQEGDYAIFVSYKEYNWYLNEEGLAVVRRFRAGLYEYTIKMATITNRFSPNPTCELHALPEPDSYPSSTTPQRMRGRPAPLTIDLSDTDPMTEPETRIVGRVIARYTRLAR